MWNEIPKKFEKEKFEMKLQEQDNIVLGSSLCLRKHSSWCCPLQEVSRCVNGVFHWRRLPGALSLFRIEEIAHLWVGFQNSRSWLDRVCTKLGENQMFYHIETRFQGFSRSKHVIHQCLELEWITMDAVEFGFLAYGFTFGQNCCCGSSAPIFFLCLVFVSALDLSKYLF